MSMSWVPPDFTQLCAVRTTVTSCSNSTVVFLQLIASLFGYSRDVRPHHVNENHRDFFKEDHAGVHHDFHIDHHDFHNDQYDFIVVGAGSAGCVVANRLTEIHGWRVLLLEAGGEEPEVADVPSFAPILQRTNIDWGYTTQPSPHSCLARPQGQCAWARGKVMGGSSTINYMVYIRGHPQDYDDWAAMGNHDWNYKSVLPYFIKSEHNGNLDSVNALYHGHGGYLSVENYPYQDKNIFPIIDSFKELGYKQLDQNAEETIGVMLLQATVRNGRRDSTNSAFIRPIRRKRENLVIQTNAHASRVLIDPHSKKTLGVEYYLNGQLKRATVSKEVIVSAGTLNSPKILMLSGIGPSSHIASHGIKLIEDLPVGLNLQDHPTIDGIVFALSNKTATTVDDDERVADVHLYKEKREGPLSAPGPAQISAFVQTKYETSKNLPDIQYAFDGISVSNFYADPILAAQINGNPLAYYDGLVIRPVLLTPESRGYILLNQSDPIFGPPLIYANTFTKEIDLLRMVDGIKQAIKVVHTKAMKNLNAQLVTIPLPACKDHDFGTDEYWTCVSMWYTATIYHTVGTCKMGPKSDKTSVVDPHLRVHGIKNLRVIDASIMPKLPRGNTNAPTIMVAEKGSDYIKSRWLKDKFETPSMPFHGNQEYKEEPFVWNS